jgi:hypothetical protein
VVLAQESPAVTRLRDFIRELRDGGPIDPSFFAGLKDLEITLEQLVEREEQLVHLDEVLAEWIASVPSDFVRPTFEQLVAHLVAIIFSLNRAFFTAMKARTISRDLRPAQLQNNQEFLSDYLLSQILTTDILTDFELRRGCVQVVADLLLRARVPIVEDDEADPQEFSRLPYHKFILELYKRARKLTPRYKEGEGSLEFRLVHSGALERTCRERPELVEFVGPNGLNIYNPEGWWVRWRRRWRRWWIERTMPSHRSALYSQIMLIAIWLLLDVIFFVVLWAPHVRSAERQADQAKAQMIQAVTDQIGRQGQGGR